MEKHLYTCKYCSKVYLPRRRNKQKFCSNSCRVNAFNQRNKAPKEDKITGVSIPHNEDKNRQKISWEGVGNAAIANVATDLAKSLLTREENKPATKGDVLGILNKFKTRYMPVRNVPIRADGAKPFYDSATETLVFQTSVSDLKQEEIRGPQFI